MSGVRLTRAYLPGMLKRNWAALFYIIRERRPDSRGNDSLRMTKPLNSPGQRHRPTDPRHAVTVNAVLPGPTASEGVTEFVSRLASQGSQRRSNLKRIFPQRASNFAFATICERGRGRNMVATCARRCQRHQWLGARVDGGVVRGTV